MTSKVAIINRALTKLGADRIVSTVEDSKEARDINATFDIVRDDELRAHRWSFAKRRAQLAASVTAPLFEYSHQFPLPVDCLRVLMVGDLWPGVDFSDYRTGPAGLDWRIEGRNILMNDEGPLDLVYLARVEDTTTWDASFIEAFACRLAAEVCESITQSSAKRQLAWEEYDRAIIKARRAGAIELPPQQIADDTWILGRVRN